MDIVPTELRFTCICSVVIKEYLNKVSSKMISIYSILKHKLSKESTLQVILQVLEISMEVQSSKIISTYLADMEKKEGKLIMIMHFTSWKQNRLNG